MARGLLVIYSYSFNPPPPVKVLLLSLAIFTPALSGLAEGVFVRHLQESADHGEAESQFILGVVHRDGWDGTIRNGTIAAKWCELAVELGDQRPALMLGLLQKAGERILKDETTAIKLLTLAASQEDNYAQVILGDMLLEGDGVPADWINGMELIRKSAVAGFAPAQFRLGIIYLVGDKTTPKNDVESLAWFIVGAESGSEAAKEYRDERTQALGTEVARLAIKRSRELLAKAENKKNPQSDFAAS